MNKGESQSMQLSTLVLEALNLRLSHSNKIFRKTKVLLKRAQRKDPQINIKITQQIGRLLEVKVDKEVKA